MKTRYYIVALATLIACACSRNAGIMEDDVQQYTIKAYQEGYHAQTKTTVLDGGVQVYWEPADEIKVFFKGYSGRFISQNTELAGVADFAGTLTLLVGANEGFDSVNQTWGLYPYRSDATYDGESVTTTLPASQTGRAGSFAKNTHISIACSGGNDLAFYNVCGGVRFSLTQEGIKEVVFQGLNDEDLAGKVKLAFVDGVPAVQEVTEGQKTITLTASNGGTFETGKWYYIVALPGTLSGGFKMTFNTDTQYATLRSSGAKTIKRGIFGSLADADENLVFKDKGREAIDLGLSVKWASWNVGASAPEEYGDYFAWGEIIPKDVYPWGTYIWCNGDYNKLTKYCPTNITDYWDGAGTPDGKTVLDLEDDAARANWGGTWRMPTYAEWTELRNNCTWTWTTQNGVKGRLVTSNINGNSIFLPAAGRRYYSYLDGAGSYGDYWSSSLDTGYPEGAWIVCFDSENVDGDYNIRCYGFSVRPVCGETVFVSDITLSESSMTMMVGASRMLSAIVTPSNATDKNVRWESSDTNVATVNESGLVTAVGVGTATITVMTVDGNKTATCSIEVKEPVPAGAVDLGLSVKWASVNLGASRPEDYGGYFAWGETDQKSSYSIYTYKWCNSSSNILTKYNTISSCGPVDNKTALDLEDDAAHANLGGTWRMPTDAEWTELRESCTLTWTTLNGVNGRLFTSNINGNSIFLPAAGYWDYSLIDYMGSNGYYWSSSLYTDYPGYAWYVSFNSSDVLRRSYYRERGFSVRPVFGETVFVSDITLSESSMTMMVGASRMLSAIVTPSNATDKNVRWESSDTNVATVNESGLVTAVGVGTATITVTTVDGNKTATCSIEVKEPDAVDLGLSVKWASVNLGASRPEDYGDYYSWGEIIPKDEYSWDTYIWCNGSSTTLTKYCPNNKTDYWDGAGTPDRKTVLDLEDDAARANWGGTWRMPTDAEWTELRNNCTWTWTTQNGVNGRLVTSNINGNSIFLPAAGYPSTSNLGSAGSSAYYWSSSLRIVDPSDAWGAFFSSGSFYGNCGDRYRGRSVRPVSE